MTIHSCGFSPSGSEQALFEMFCSNVELLIEHRAAIRDCADYFFCQFPFAWCSWPYVSGDGLLPTGYTFVQKLQSRFPTEVSDWEEYAGQVFSWDGRGLEPAVRKRLVVRKTANPVEPEVLLRELLCGQLRKGAPPNLSMLTARLELKLLGKK